jgi:hypothetical protein
MRAAARQGKTRSGFQAQECRAILRAGVKQNDVHGARRQQCHDKRDVHARNFRVCFHAQTLWRFCRASPSLYFRSHPALIHDPFTTQRPRGEAGLRVMNLMRIGLIAVRMVHLRIAVVRAGLWHGRVLILALAFVDRIALFRFRLPASQIQGRKTNTEFWHWAQADRH